MFSNLSRQRVIFVIAILVLALTSVVSMANNAIRMVSNTAFSGRPQPSGAVPQAGGVPGTPGQPPDGGFVPPSDFQPRNLGQEGTDSTQSSQYTRGARVPGMGAFGGFAGRSGSSNIMGSLFRLGIDPRYFTWIGLAFSVLFLAGLLFSANAALHGRAWGLNLATGLAVLSLVTSIPGLLALPTLLQRGFNLTFMLNPALSVINVLAAAVIIVLAILPSFRDEFATVEEDDDR